MRWAVETANVGDVPDLPNTQQGKFPHQKAPLGESPPYGGGLPRLPPGGQLHMYTPPSNYRRGSIAARECEEIR